MSKDVLLCLFKPRKTPSHALKLPKRRPIGLSKYKAASLPRLQTALRVPVNTLRTNAVDLDSLSKTIRAYNEAAAKKNSFRPDQLANLGLSHEAKDAPIKRIN
jgi:hypothetical protein